MTNRDAVIVATARTPIGRAYRGAFNNTTSPLLASHAIRAAVERAGVEPAEVDDCILGCSLPQGVQSAIGRTAALHAGLPVTVAGMTIDRQCSSGLMTIATAAKQVIVDRMDVVVAGGVESISMVQTPALRIDEVPSLVAMHPGHVHADARHGGSRSPRVTASAARRRTLIPCSRSSERPPHRPRDDSMRRS